MRFEIYQPTVESNIAKLPAVCATRHPMTGQPALIRAGKRGFQRAHRHLDVDSFNRYKGVTPAQIEAMEFGALVGWDTPGADPDGYATPVGHNGTGQGGNPSADASPRV